MADVVVTPADVIRSGTNGVVRTAEFGEAVTAGQMVYQSATDQNFYLADATDPTKPANTGQLWISMSNGGAGQQGVVARSNAQVDFGAGTLSPGEVYVISSANPGGIAPVADLAIGADLSLIGYAVTDQLLTLAMQVTNVTKV